MCLYISELSEALGVPSAAQLGNARVELGIANRLGLPIRWPHAHKATWRPNKPFYAIADMEYVCAELRVLGLGMALCLCVLSVNLNL